MQSEVRQSCYGDAVIRYGKGGSTSMMVSSDSSDVLHRMVLMLEEGPNIFDGCKRLRQGVGA